MKVPWLPKSGIEAIAADVLAGYEEMIGTPVAPPIPGEDLIERYLDLRIGFMDFEPCVCNWPFIARSIQKTGGFSNVSKQAIIIRLQELGLVINETTAEIGWHRRQYAT
ncbi:MAG: hypothetical protein ACWGNK_14365 [Desulfobacterales bacterium]